MTLTTLKSCHAIVKRRVEPLMGTHVPMETHFVIRN